MLENRAAIFKQYSIKMMIDSYSKGAFDKLEALFKRAYKNHLRVSIEYDFWPEEMFIKSVKRTHVHCPHCNYKQTVLIIGAQVWQTFSQMWLPNELKFKSKSNMCHCEWCASQDDDLYGYADRAYERLLSVNRFTVVVLTDVIEKDRKVTHVDHKSAQLRTIKIMNDFLSL